MIDVRISVIIPCYNASRYIAEAIKSITSQLSSPTEIIVIDDGSTDGSSDIVRTFGAGVVLHCQANAGAGAARNTGVALARGEYLGFLDADDLWPASSLAARIAALESAPEIDCVFGRVEQFTSPDLDPQAAAAFRVDTAPTSARLAGTMLIGRAAFINVGGFDPLLRIGEMIDWWSRAEAKAISIRYIDQVCLRRRIHGNNTVLREAHRKSDYLHALKGALDRRRANEAERRRT
jgi:glycosyltransferase involved in cell wall biosynthesis